MNYYNPTVDIRYACTYSEQDMEGFVSNEHYCAVPWEKLTAEQQHMYTRVLPAFCPLRT